jgi:hypothetical protein
MRRLLLVCLYVFSLAAAFPVAPAAAARGPELASADSVLRWINAYRTRPDPEAVPQLVRNLSELNGFKEPESSGVYVGFIAGVIGANPQKADALIARMFPLPEADQWVIVRAIAYSGLPDWRERLQRLADRMPTRAAMIASYLDGRQKTLFAVEPDGEPAFWQKVARSFRFGGEQTERSAAIHWALDPSPELIDTLWGYYFATGNYGPVLRLIAMLPWSKERDNVDRLTLGSIVKYTLASNAARDMALLALLKRANAHEDEKIKPVLQDVIDAAETAQTARIRKEALAAIDELKRKGPGSTRDLTSWGKAGELAISGGCIAAAVAGQVALGLPCVVGGALSSAALRYLAGP